MVAGPAPTALKQWVLGLLEDCPLYRGAMPRTGTPLSVRNTNLGPLGWVSDIKGYRYQPTHPVTGRAWAAIPQAMLDLWETVSNYPAPPQACLVNWYEANSRLGLHIDADETAKDAPVVSVSLGSRALFRLGGLERKSPTSSMRLASGEGREGEVALSLFHDLGAGIALMMRRGPRLVWANSLCLFPLVLSLSKHRSSL